MQWEIFDEEVANQTGLFPEEKLPFYPLDGVFQCFNSMMDLDDSSDTTPLCPYSSASIDLHVNFENSQLLSYSTYENLGPFPDKNSMPEAVRKMKNYHSDREHALEHIASKYTLNRKTGKGSFSKECILTTDELIQRREAEVKELYEKRIKEAEEKGRRSRDR